MNRQGAITEARQRFQENHQPHPTVMPEGPETALRVLISSFDHW